jgi:valyl-tRNA synthetase
MSEISKAYEPQSVEAKWYQFWLDRNCFTANPHSPKPAYSIVIPPPNVTGVLTLGHVLNNTIQDILARKARMDGKEVLWLPGTDHAGIATENVVSRQLRKEEHKTKQDIGREEFLKRVWTWKEKHGGIILQQLKALGASCDWTRTRFTMDEHYKSCVTRVFVDLYKKGLIYRGKRMVNWCPATLTALSDEEVIMKEQKGALYYFKVEVDSGSAGVPPANSGVSPESPAHGEALGGTPDAVRGTRALPTFLTIATTRPETIPGDTAVAVNPKDPRYAHLIGKHVVRPLPAELPREQKLIPIVGDEHVDFEFGTGVLKVTPAHDKADFEIAQRHKLPVVEVINADGSMNALAGAPLAGLDRFKARKVAVEQLTELGALEKEEPYTNNVGFSERADVPIEPRLSEQWFLKYPSVAPSKNCVEQEGSARVPRADSGVPPESSQDVRGMGEALGGTPDAARETRALPEKMHFYPPRWAKVYDHWMNGIQDWCISRQLWWGHRIPVWTKQFASSEQKNIGISLLQQVVGDHIARAGSPEKLAGQTFTLEQDGNVSDDYLLFRMRWSEGGELSVEAATYSTLDGELLDRNGFTQDPDVLDTWFSSWLWPFATMGWPEKTDELKKFYPTTDLVTGPDIIFFWVARMIMAGYEWMGEMPFRNVYFTGIIRDKQGRKMSKSLGNSPDPLDLINTYGADALRFGIMRSAPQGQDLLFDEQSVELGRNFCNKLWNACRFRQMQGSAGVSPADSGVPPESSAHVADGKASGATPNAARGTRALPEAEFEDEIRPELLTSDDKWILLKLDAAIREVTDALNGYRFNEAANALYRFFWSEYCDWYVESVKAVLQGSAGVPPADSGVSPESSAFDADGKALRATPNAARETRALPDARALARRQNTLAVMDFVLSNTLRLFHPFLPFITEELWQGMGFNDDLPRDQGGDTIMFAHWPKPFDHDMKDFYALDDCYLERVEAKHELVRQGRNLRSEARIAANKKVRFVLKPVNGLPPHDLEVLKLLLHAEQFEVDDTFAPGKGTARALTPLGELFLPLEGLIDVEAERTRLQKELEKIRVEIEKVSQKLSNPNFAQKVPPKVLEEHHQRLADWNAKHAQTLAALEALG